MCQFATCNSFFCDTIYKGETYHISNPNHHVTWRLTCIAKHLFHFPNCLSLPWTFKWNHKKRLASNCQTRVIDGNGRFYRGVQTGFPRNPASLSNGRSCLRPKCLGARMKTVQSIDPLAFPVDWYDLICTHWIAIVYTICNCKLIVPSTNSIQSLNKPHKWPSPGRNLPALLARALQVSSTALKVHQILHASNTNSHGGTLNVIKQVYFWTQAEQCLVLLRDVNVKMTRTIKKKW